MQHKQSDRCCPTNRDKQGGALQETNKMVIVVEGRELPPSSCDSGPSGVFSLHPRLEEEARRMAAGKDTVVRPEGVMYARQKVNKTKHK